MKLERSIVGVDGCRGGWIAVFECGNSVRAFVATSVVELLGRLDPETLVAIDIPIGLTDIGARSCDVAARRFLKAPRSSSVFPAPIRPVLRAVTYEDARRIHLEVAGKSVSKQAFAIYPKIREVDEALRTSPTVHSRVREVHPEVSFAYWNDGKAMSHGKKSTAGAAERERLIDQVWPGVRAELRAELPRSVVKRDDLNDAFAALWTARRILAGRAVTLPDGSIRDTSGLVMEIVA